MNSGTDAESEHRFEVRVTSDSHFGWLRTRMALERTMMAWLRSAVALIGFGFTIVQFFERLNAMEGVEAAMQPFAARYVGLALIAAGVLVLGISAWQYKIMQQYLWHGDFAILAGVDKAPRKTPLFPITIMMIFIGVLAFLSVLVRAV
jgi:putative membrane protein